MLWDRVEPNGYTHHVSENLLPGTNTKEVLTRVAIGDHQVTTYAGHLMARTLKAPHLTTGLRDIWELEPVASTESGSFYTEYDFGLPGQPVLQRTDVDVQRPSIRLGSRVWCVFVRALRPVHFDDVTRSVEDRPTGVERLVALVLGDSSRAGTSPTGPCLPVRRGPDTPSASPRRSRCADSAR